MSKNAMAKLAARANHLVSQHGLTAEAREGIDNALDKYVEFAQVAPGQPNVVIVDIPFDDIIAAVGIAKIPEKDAVWLAKAYLEHSVKEHVDRDKHARVLVDDDRQVIVIALAPKYIAMESASLVRTKEYTTCALQPFAMPAPRKRARPGKAAEPAESAEPAEMQ